MSNWLHIRDPKTFIRVCDMIEAGKTIREVVRATGVSKNTIGKIRRVVLFQMEAEGKPILCPCGQPTGHRAWCSYRFKNSPRRQRVMAKMHETRQWLVQKNEQYVFTPEHRQNLSVAQSARWARELEQV